MKQIDEQWRENPNDPSNRTEVLGKIMNSFEYSETHLNDIQNYRDTIYSQFLRKKCADVCLNANKLPFNSCLENCGEKLIETTHLFEDISDKFSKTYLSHIQAGRDYFKS
jgi:hypothetical protein